MTDDLDATTDDRTPKEVIYDEQLHPLMAQIIAICKEHRINMAAQFSLGHDDRIDDTLLSSTYLLHKVEEDGDEKGHARILSVVKAMKPEPQLLAFTIISGDRP